MPTKRRRMTRGLVTEVSDLMVVYLGSGNLKDSDESNCSRGEWLDVFRKMNSREQLRADWLEIRAKGFLDWWIVEWPGTRPAAWWWFDAPRWQREDMPARVQPITALDIAEPRRRLGGVGTPAYEALNSWPAFDRGLPVEWIHPRIVESYRRDGDFGGVAPSVDDPPTYESVASYLDRHGLLTADERRRLPTDAFEPEAIEIPADDPPTLRVVRPKRARTNERRRKA